MKDPKKQRVRDRLVLGDTFKLVDKMDDPKATIESVASTAMDVIEKDRDQVKDRVLRVGEVANIVGLSKQEIYRRIRTGKDFPTPIELGGEGPRRRVGWLRSEVMQWLRTRARARG